MNAIIEKMIELMGRSGSDAIMPATQTFYNEGWLLRLILDWYSTNKHPESLIEFASDARWFSEGSLASPFMAREKNDPKAEGYTKADGVVGHFDIAPTTKSRILLKDNAKQLVVIEAKLGSDLSPDINNAPDYDQAARNACCLAHIVSESKCDLKKLDSFAFYVIAPRIKIDNPKSKFKEWVNEVSIKKKVENRARDYGKEANWYKGKFKPVFCCMTVDCKSWEDILLDMRNLDCENIDEYESFYAKCKKENYVEKS